MSWFTDWLRPHQIGVEVDVDLVQISSHTENFDLDGFLVTRRGTTFPIQLNTRSRLTITSATLVYEEGKEVALTVVKLDHGILSSTLEVSCIINDSMVMVMQLCSLLAKLQQQMHYLVCNYSDVHQKSVFYSGGRYCILPYRYDTKYFTIISIYYTDTRES